MQVVDKQQQQQQNQQQQNYNHQHQQQNHDHDQQQRTNKQTNNEYTSEHESVGFLICKFSMIVGNINLRNNSKHCHYK